MTERELEQKVFEMTVLTGQKYMKTGVLEDWTLSTEIMRLIKRYGIQQRIDERTTLLRGSTPGSLTAASHQYRIDELRKQKAAL